jgi:hypothetical protein
MYSRDNKFWLEISEDCKLSKKVDILTALEGLFDTAAADPIYAQAVVVCMRFPLY